MLFSNFFKRKQSCAGSGFNYFPFSFFVWSNFKAEKSRWGKNEEGNVKGISEKRGKMLNEKKLKMETNGRYEEETAKESLLAKAFPLT